MRRLAVILSLAASCAFGASVDMGVLGEDGSWLTAEPGVYVWEMSAAGGPLAHVAGEPGMVACYHLDGDMFDIVSGTTGTVSSATFVEGAAVGSQCLYAGVSQWANTVNSGLTYGSRSWAMSLWVKFKTYKADAGVVFAKGSTTWGFVQVTAGKMRFHSNGGWSNQFDTPASNEWVMITGICTNSANNDGYFTVYVGTNKVVNSSKWNGLGASTQNDVFRLNVNDANTAGLSSTAYYDELTIWTNVPSDEDIKRWAGQ